jgi:hypothetical protein
MKVENSRQKARGKRERSFVGKKIVPLPNEILLKMKRS